MIVVSPLHELADSLARVRPSHIVSLSSPGSDPIDLPDDLEALRLSFHDIAEPREGLVPVTPEQITALLAFATTRTGDRPILIHCWAGVSRSPAAAYILACARGAPGEERALAERLRRVAPFATPNPRMIAQADDLLARDGRMSQAIAAIGRGAETGLGSAFVFD